MQQPPRVETVSRFLLLTCLVVTASSAQLFLMIQDEILKRKLREAQETRERLRVANQESKQMVGKKDHRNKNPSSPLSSLLHRRQQTPASNELDGGGPWEFRITWSG